MQNIVIGRYSAEESASHSYAGWVEGVRDDGTTWIMWLDGHGNPQSYWGARDPDGGVVGDAINLPPRVG